MPARSLIAPDRPSALGPPRGAGGVGKEAETGLRQILKEKGFWGCLLLGVVFFYRPLLTDEVFFFRDLLLYVLQKNVLLDLVAAGEWPLWNPYLHAGMPYLGDISNFVLYPSTLLYLVLPPFKAVSVDAALHVMAAAAAAYLLARRLGLAAAAAAVAAAAYGYCGYTLSQANVLVRLLATPYLPLMVLFQHLFVTERRWRWFAAAAVCGTLQVFAGGPTVIVLTCATVLAWTVFALRDGSWRRRLGLGVALWVLVGALTAVQLVPLAETTSQSSRGEGLELDDFTGWSLAPRRLPELVVPGFLGTMDTMAPARYWGRLITDTGAPYVLSIYFGPVLLVLALCGAAAQQSSLSRRLRVLLVVLAGLALVLSMGRFVPFFTAFHRVPGLSVFRYPIKFLALGTLPTALLAAAGAEALLAPGAAMRQRRVLTAAAFATVAALAALLFVFDANTPLAQKLEIFFFRQTTPAISEGLANAFRHTLLFFSVTVLIWLAHRHRPHSSLPWILAGVVFLDLMLYGRSVNFTAPLEMLAAKPAAADVAKTTLEAGRTLPGRLYRAPDLPGVHLPNPPTDNAIWRYRWYQEVLTNCQGAAYGLPLVFHADFHNLAPRRVVALGRVAESVPWPQRLPLLSAAAASALMTPERLDLPGLEYVATIHNLSTSSYYLYRNTQAMDRVAWVGYWKVVSSQSDAVRALLAPGFDPRRHAVVEGAVGAKPDLDCSAPAEVRPEISSVHYRRLAVSSFCPGLLVFSEAFYPGWRARVDGEPAPLLHANVAFSALYLEPGEHRVEWRYVPASVIAGAAASSVTVLGLALVSVVLAWRRRRGGRAPCASQGSRARGRDHDPR